MADDNSASLKFYSVRQWYTGPNAKPDLELAVHYYGDDAVEVALNNTKYSEQLRNLGKRLMVLLCLYGIYFASTTPFIGANILQSNKVFDLAFLFWLLHITHSVFGLIKKEKLLFCLDFALQLHTERFWFRHSHTFICVTNIHDIVINEIIEDLDIHYMMVVRTAGDLFKQKPVIPIFNSLRPSVDCLNAIYNSLNKVLGKNRRKTS